jgi:hypothetical protein
MTRAEPHDVSRRQCASEQRQNHRRFDQHSPAQAAGVHDRNFTFGIKFAQRHEQTEEQTERQDKLRHLWHTEAQ